ncbi:type II toxin-antitoxin system HicA family toxin [Candidatus Poriferisodalis sp.]|uniref:type II toxin-antitoxin system HicA family toxin n=1 Tax=Candidatus Poriferisodalis sp. TaxID=3101277 RepID=UPI003B5A223C
MNPASASSLPALKAREVLRLLKQIGYQEIRRKGSHRKLAAEGRLPIGFAFHDGVEVPPHQLRRMLVDRAGLTSAEISDLL